jgi:hypothetical protein
MTAGQNAEIALTSLNAANAPILAHKSQQEGIPIQPLLSTVAKSEMAELVNIQLACLGMLNPTVIGLSRK